MARKARSDSKLDQLEANVRQDLIDLFLHDNAPLTYAKKWLDEEHDVSISTSSLHAWFHRVVWPLKLEMRKQRATQANALISEAQGKAVDWTSAVEEEVAQQAYEMLSSGVMPKMALSYARTALGVEDEKNKLRLAQEKLKQGQQKLEQDHRRLKLLEDKARRADEAAEQMQKLKAGGDMLPEEERAAILSKVDEILNIKK